MGSQSAEHRSSIKQRNLFVATWVDFSVWVWFWPIKDEHFFWNFLLEEWPSLFPSVASENHHHPDAHILTLGRLRPIKCAHRKFSKIQTNRSKGGPKKIYSRFLRTHGVDRDIQLALKIFEFRFLGPPLFRFS